jgi:transposase
MPKIAQITPRRVVIGVDTHKDVHVAVALDGLGRRLGETTVPTSAAGYRNLVAWSLSIGEIETFGLEGTGSYGAALSRHLRAGGHQVVEVVRPNRQARRRNGKSDPADAEAAARAVLSGEASGCPKAGDDLVEMIRVLRVARSTAVKARTQAINALKAILVTAPVELRDQLHGLSTTALIAVAARMRPGTQPTTVAANKTALRALASRYQALNAEITALDRQLAELTAEAAPQLTEAFGVGPDVAGALLVAAGDNPDRLHSEAAFAMLCGAAPIEASSGKTVRHRLNRGGDRHANAALYRIVLVRMRFHAPTRAYVERRTTQGLSKPEIIRCLKRYVAREMYTLLRNDTKIPSVATA